MNTRTLQNLCIKVIVKNIFKDLVSTPKNAVDSLEIPTSTKKIVIEEVLKIQESCCPTLDVCPGNVPPPHPRNLTTISAHVVAKQICQHPSNNLTIAIKSLKLPKIIEMRIVGQTRSELLSILISNDNRRLIPNIVYNFNYTDSYSYS